MGVGELERWGGGCTEKVKVKDPLQTIQASVLGVGVLSAALFNMWHTHRCVLAMLGMQARGVKVKGGGGGVGSESGLGEPLACEPGWLL